MFRKVSQLLAILVIVNLVQADAYALGFRPNVKMNSTLNQPLDAEILFMEKPTESELESIKIKLASREVFEIRGIDRSVLLTKIKYKVKKRNNDYYIHVTSNENIREPFMDFIIAIESSSGKFLFKFIVLIDPPRERSPEPASVIETPVAEPQAEVLDAEEDLITEPEASPFTEPETTESGAQAGTDSTVIPVLPLDEDTTESGVDVEDVNSDSEPVLLEDEPETIVNAEPVAEVPDAFSEPDGENSQGVEPELDADRVEVDEPIINEQVQLEDDSQTDAFVEGEGLFPHIPIDENNESLQAQQEGVVAEKIEDADTDRNQTGSTDESGTVGSLDYGITKKNDNLWMIAEKLREGNPSVTIYQIMMALLQSNPEAFIDNNVHRLKVGYVMRIEDPGLLTQMTNGQALDMYQDQTVQWDEYRQNIAANIDTQAVDTSDIDVGSGEDTADADSGQLTLVTPNNTDTVSDGGTGTEETADAQQLSDLANLREDLKRAISEAGSSNIRSPELNKRLLDLEDELNSMQRMLTVEDDELAALQQQLHQLNEAAAVEPTIDETEPADETAQTETTPEAVGEPEVISSSELSTDNVQADTDVVADPDESLDEDVVVEGDLPPVEDKGIVDTTLSAVSGAAVVMVANIIYIGAAIGALLLIIVVVVLIKKRAAANDGMQESILMSGEISEMNTIADSADGSGPASAGMDSTSSEESSFLSDFAISGMNAIEEDSEVDPLTEADVFMAYGRYEAAEERLQDAIKSDPNRNELKLKLIELFYTVKNKESFESTAEDFYASLGGSASVDPMWEKVLSMGAELAPENPIFSGGTPAVDVTKVRGAPASKDDVMDIGLDTGVFNSVDLNSTATNGDTAELGTDETAGDYNFDLGINTTGDLNGDLESEASTSTTSGLDFDLNLDADDTSENVGSVDSTSLDFDLDSTEELETDTGGSMEFDVGSNLESSGPSSEFMDLGLDEQSSDSEPTADINASGGLDFDLPADTGIGDLNLDAADASDDMDISMGMDEVGTKLDLAKAYIDMGDPDGAKSILDEVIDEGNDSQKQEAQELIHQIV